jgi:DNA-binding transcriptional LysR family regulator
VREKETIETRDLRLFDEVVRRRSLTAAAAALDVPKSIVSKRLAALEERLGVRLIERTTRRIEVTQAGRVLQLRAQSLLGEVDGLAADLRQLETQVRGRVTIAAPPDLGAQLAGTLVPRFIAAHPEVSVSLRLDYGFTDLFDPDLDLAFRIGEARDDRLVARAVGELRHVLVASPAFARRHRTRAPAELAALPALSFFDDAELARWRLTDGRRVIDVGVRALLTARSFPALLRAAEAGLGVAYVPAFVAREPLQQRRLVRVLSRWASPPRPILLVHRYGHHRVRRVAALIEMVLADPALTIGVATASVGLSSVARRHQRSASSAT